MQTWISMSGGNNRICYIQHVSTCTANLLTSYCRHRKCKIVFFELRKEWVQGFITLLLFKDVKVHICVDAFSEPDGSVQIQVDLTVLRFSPLFHGLSLPEWFSSIIVELSDSLSWNLWKYMAILKTIALIQFKYLWPEIINNYIKLVSSMYY